MICTRISYTRFAKKVHYITYTSKCNFCQRGTAAYRIISSVYFEKWMSWHVHALDSNGILFSSDATAVSSQRVRVPQKKDVLCGSLGLGHEFTIAQQLAMTFVSWVPGLVMWNIKHRMHAKLCNTWNMQENVTKPTRNQVDLIPKMSIWMKWLFLSIFRG